jgi:hypothetical protein
LGRSEQRSSNEPYLAARRLLESRAIPLSTVRGTGAVTGAVRVRGTSLPPRAAALRHQATQPRRPRLSARPPPLLLPCLAPAARSTVCFAARGGRMGRLPILPFIVQGASAGRGKERLAARAPARASGFCMSGRVDST